MVFTIFPGQQFDLLKKNVGAKALYYTYTYPTPPLLKYNNVNYGMSLDKFEQAYKTTGKKVDFLTVAGYNSGLIMQKTLEDRRQFRSVCLQKSCGRFFRQTHDFGWQVRN